MIGQLEKGDVGPPVCIRRRYIMLYVPSGFWSRLITRIMINLKRTGLMDTGKKKAHRDALYWRRGIYIAYKSGRFLVKAMNVSIDTGQRLLTYICTYAQLRL